MSSQESANKFYSIEEVLSLPDAEWLIQDFLPKASFAVLFGPPSVGKSFLALHLALAIAAGKDWFGRDVKGGPVIYIPKPGRRTSSPSLSAPAMDSSMASTA